MAKERVEHPARSAPNVTPIRTELWREAAACRGTDPNLFFPEEEDGEVVDEAKAVCAACAVREQCLESALEAREQYGVWGGTTPLERRRLLRRRRRRIA